MNNVTRTYFWHYVVDSEGRPIENAEVLLYLNDDPTVEATIFLSETASTYTTCSKANMKTDNNGFFGFWLGNEFEDGGHAFTQTFQLDWYKAGTRPGLIKDINPWPNILAWVDTNSGADKEYRNKFVSDFLANKWYTHYNELIPDASPHDLHPVQYDSCLDNRYNKVVSDLFLNDIYNNSIAAGSILIPNQNVGEVKELVTSWTSSGSTFYKDISHPDFNHKDVTVHVIKDGSKMQIMPKRIINLTSTVTRIFMNSELDVTVNVQGSFKITFTFLVHNSGSSDMQAVVLETPGSQSYLGLSYSDRASMLSDQRVVICGYDGSYNEVRCYLAGTTTLDWSYTITGYQLGYGADICVLNNGNIVAYWIEYNSDTPYFIILDSSGGLVQGVTNADTSTGGADYDDGFSIIALVDGGFCCNWRGDGSSWSYASLWNANGTVRQTKIHVEGNNELSPLIQFASGNIVTFDSGNGYAFYYSPTDLSLIEDYVLVSSTTYKYYYSDKLSSWTDKIALVYEWNGDIYGTVLDDTGNSVVDDVLILANAAPVTLLALPNQTFLMQYTNVGSNGEYYYILNANLSIISGPTLAFTGSVNEAFFNLRGAAG